MSNHPEEVDRIVMKWAAENPIVTNRMKFREVFGMDLVLPEKEAAIWLDQEYKGGTG